MTRKSFVAAGGEGVRPGLKWDYVLTIIGSEAWARVRCWRRWARMVPATCSTLIDGTRGMEQLQRVWIMELGELSVYKKAEVEPRRPSSRSAPIVLPRIRKKKSEIYPRQCGVHRHDKRNNFLKGDTGNRRFYRSTRGCSPQKEMKDPTTNERPSYGLRQRNGMTTVRSYFRKELEAEANCRRRSTAKRTNARNHRGLHRQTFAAWLGAQSRDERRNTFRHSTRNAARRASTSATESPR